MGYDWKVIWTVLALLLCPGFLSGCLSAFYWAAFENRRRQGRVESASVNEHRFRARVRYRTGRSYLVEARLKKTSEYIENYGYVHGRFADFSEDTPGWQAVALKSRKPDETDGIPYLVGDDHDAYVDLYWGDAHYLIGLPGPAPISWLSLDTYLTILGSPFPAALDLVTLPIQIVFFSVNPVPI